MKRPSLDVSIITYNHRDFIGRAIDSALAQQTDFPVTIHIGDDFSDDGTRGILQTYRDRYPDRIVLNLQPERPSGIPGRVNNIANLESCTGDYLALLDGDDYWLDPLKLQRQVDFLERSPGHGGAAHGFVISRSPETLSYDQVRQDDGKPLDCQTADIFDKQLIQTSTFVCRRHLIQFPDWFNDVHAADYALFLMAASHGPIHFDPRIRSVYQQHRASVTDRQGNTEWAQTFVHDWPLLAKQFPQAVTLRQKMNLLRARRIVALAEGRFAEAALLAGQLVGKDPAAITRWLEHALGRRR
ncbi:glycosyltransferase [Erythrobacter sp.]|jgi:glycosyltransferase involved in cell wall biosynthesis|uniref:glycosyltransferase n=1 Tax=Erythrobacter sp. TaxID=1042 RepID=UPI002ECCB6BF|nr:glycosyltransferase [Erythrobacter sp.]